MSAFDLEKMLAPVSPESPSGENLEYDPAYIEMMRTAQGKPEQRMGDAVIPAEEPNWKEVKAQALRLLARSRDLRTATLLARALLFTDGLAGLADGVGLVRGLTERFWDSVHPQLDPTDGNDPTFRLNTIQSLAGPDTMLRGIRLTPLAASRVHGRVTLRDVLIATGKMPRPASDTATPDASVVDGVFRDCDPEQLRQTSAAVGRALEQFRGLASALDEKAGSGSSAALAEVSGLLKSADKVLQERMVGRGLAMGAEGAAEAGAGPGESAAGRPGAGGRAMSLDGEVTSREQAIQLLDKVADFFVRNEPSSPVPLLLRRAKRLISRSFMDIVRDLAPDALAQVEKIRGEESND